MKRLSDGVHSMIRSAGRMASHCISTSHCSGSQQCCALRAHRLRSRSRSQVEVWDRRSPIEFFNHPASKSVSCGGSACLLHPPAHESHPAPTGVLADTLLLRAFIGLEPRPWLAPLLSGHRLLTCSRGRAQQRFEPTKNTGESSVHVPLKPTNAPTHTHPHQSERRDRRRQRRRRRKRERHHHGDRRAGADEGGA